MRHSGLLSIPPRPVENPNGARFPPVVQCLPRRPGRRRRPGHVAAVCLFGPFLKLIVLAGVADLTFGTSIWLVVFTVVMVSAMYRLVMRWVVDGSGGSGLTEEEFGPWAVKVNAGITFVEYTLTFLVSVPALVTFLADRKPGLNATAAGLQYRTVLAIVLSLAIGGLVNPL